MCAIIDVLSGGVDENDEVHRFEEGAPGNRQSAAGHLCQSRRGLHREIWSTYLLFSAALTNTTHLQLKLADQILAEEKHLPMYQVRSLSSDPTRDCTQTGLKTGALRKK